MKNKTFNQICNVFEDIESVSSRNIMTEKLASLFEEMSLEDGQIVSYLIMGRLAPSFVSHEFNYSEKSILSVLDRFSKKENLQIDVYEVRKKMGDIGNAVEEFSKKAGFVSNEMSLKDVYSSLWEIMKISGSGSVVAKGNLVIEMLKRLSPLESKYFARIICGSLRFGLNTRTLLDAFSVLSKGDKSIREKLDMVYGVNPDVGVVFKLLSEDRLEDVPATPGIPILSRLVERVKGFEEVFDRVGDSFFVQPKYDGLRCQIHKYSKAKVSNKESSIWNQYIENSSKISLFEKTEDSTVVNLFSRNLEDITEMFPEIVESARAMPEESFILDSEILGWDSKNKKFLPFQETMTRRRKHGIKGKLTNVPVKAMVFDLLSINNEDIVGESTKDRLKMLEGLEFVGGIEKTETRVVEELETLEKCFREWVDAGFEGLIVKKMDGKYLPGSRNYEWIKLKKSMEKGLVDSVDLVALGYYLGSGRRSKLGIGALLGGIYNEEEDRYEGVCKVGTGFSDEQLISIYGQLEEISLESIPKNVVVRRGLEPDVYIDPKYVFTVEADEVSKNVSNESNSIGKGFSLRFPRLAEWDRDKGITEATTVKELESMYIR